MFSHSLLFVSYSILNKLTPEKFDKLCLELLNVGVESKLILKGIILLVRKMHLLEKLELFKTDESVEQEWSCKGAFSVTLEHNLNVVGAEYIRIVSDERVF